MDFPTLEKIRTPAELATFDRRGRRIGICTGCFDVLQSGHAVFFEQCKAYCDYLIVIVGRGAPISKLKPGRPINPDNNRLYLVAALEAVDCAVLGDETYTGSKIDCVGVCDALCPDVYIVNDDDSGLSEKRAFCEARGIELCLVSRIVPEMLSPTSSTEIIQKAGMVSTARKSEEDEPFPFRLCLTGGWLDQPWVSKVCPGAVTVFNIQADERFCFRGGMATSTRETARKLWRQFPGEDFEAAAKILFGAENPPGSAYVSGSQDALGLCLPGFNRLNYRGGYWPESIESNRDPGDLRWLESVIYLVSIGERPANYDPLIEKHLTPESVAELAETSEMAWRAVWERDVVLLGKAVSQTLESWRKILPNTVPRTLDPVLAQFEKYEGRTLTGCGGGYVLVISSREVPGAIRVRARF